MNLQSMTGFARSEAAEGRYRIVWELRSVNGKGLDLRLRLPNRFERLETDVRRQVGIVDIREVEDGEGEAAARDAAILSCLSDALTALREMRQSEGRALSQVLAGQVAQIAALAAVVEADPSRSPEEIARRLSQQVATVLQDASALDPARLHAEVALLATKADLREEIDRLKAHVAAATELLEKGGPIGRRLDFLAQEFNRESNTICSKSNSAAVTAAGLDLKVVIDQFREQVQNLE